MVDAASKRGETGGEARLVDARGLRCPLPVLRVARAVRVGGPGTYLVRADDPVARTDIPAYAAEMGWSQSPEGDHSWLILVPPAQG